MCKTVLDLKENQIVKINYSFIVLVWKKTFYRTRLIHNQYKCKSDLQGGGDPLIKFSLLYYE